MPRRFLESLPAKPAPIGGEEFEHTDVALESGDPVTEAQEHVNTIRVQLEGERQSKTDPELLRAYELSLQLEEKLLEIRKAESDSVRRLLFSEFLKTENMFNAALKRFREREREEMN